MKRIEVLFGVLRVPLDALAIVAALLLSYRLRQANINLFPLGQFAEGAGTLPPLPEYLSSFVAPSIFVFLALAAVLGLYTLRSTLSAWSEVGMVWVIAALWMIIVIGWYFLYLREFIFSRALLLYGVFFIAAFATVGRMALTLLQRSLLRAGIGRRVVVSVGKQALAIHAHQTLKHDEHYWYLGHIADLDALKRFMHQRPIDLVLQTDPNPDSDRTIALISYCRSHHVGYGFLPPVLADVPHQLRVDRLGLLPLIRFQPTPLDGWGRVFKRLFDIVISLVSIIVLSPLLLLTALLILIDSGWPVFYISVRTGEQGRKRMHVLKFRSMVKDADTKKAELLAQNHRRDGPLFKMKNDPRVTRIGRILRRTSIDELPQLFNVLAGHMSLVGPRPHLPEEVARYSLEQRRVFAVKPGITGLAQVSGRSDLSFEEEVRLDLQYIEEWSILLDLWIMWRTVWTLVSRKGAD
jgi:exopolysaccharide biosynthesis polyprenyl glycosylphosphotransferase